MMTLKEFVSIVVRGVPAAVLGYHAVLYLMILAYPRRCS